MMLPHIIIATDGSEASDRMIECVKGLHRVGQPGNSISRARRLYWPHDVAR
jgi:hypothetical protein